MLLEQVFDLTEKSLSYLIGWTFLGNVSCSKLQEIEQCSKPKDSYMQLLKVAWEMLQARYTLKDLILQQTLLQLIA